MIIKTLKARILRALKAAGHDGAAGSPPPSPTKPAAHQYQYQYQYHGSDALSDDASFFDAREPDTPPTKAHHRRRRPSAAEPLDAWELVDDDQDDGGCASPAAPDADPLLGFPARCPPGGESVVVLYTTTLRGVRRTFEDCNVLRSLLENLGAPFQERDVSMDRGLRDQLWSLTGERGAVPPRLFVRGRDVGGAAQVLALHEEGRLVPLLPVVPPSPCAGGDTKLPGAGGKRGCDACGGLRFVVCGECDGSRKVFDGGRCRGCNENGLVMCPLCL
ncbi:uncharacterized protein At5g39865 [Sorghum bicolor]|uniref:Glutaredoxin domain-containing protein n=1 Tax=Sorghum bicolor TaxID=4558 RepID=C5X9N3_SORBI|nr:uncharacterized protein At5g39865 [Sorghum bicolor]EER95886.1 hypothetical protein SORBI_3002G039100 [Sorghum bicolor]|eukprot:XP_002459365.1 uncharacterized protein At5g39865 [Sorghum bicolor]